MRSDDSIERRTTWLFRRVRRTEADRKKGRVTAASAYIQSDFEARSSNRSGSKNRFEERRVINSTARIDSATYSSLQRRLGRKSVCTTTTRYSCVGAYRITFNRNCSVPEPTASAVKPTNTTVGFRCAGARASLINVIRGARLVS